MFHLERLNVVFFVVENYLNIKKFNLGSAHKHVAIVELCIDDNISVQNVGGHHL